MGNLSIAMEGLVGAIRSSTRARRAELIDLQTYTHDNLRRFREQRCEGSQTVRKGVRRQLAEIRQTARGLRQAVRSELSGIASDLGAARRLWILDTEPRDSSAAARKVLEPPLQTKPARWAAETLPTRGFAFESGSSPLPAAKPEAELTGRLSEREQILRVLGGHPDGIRLVDIGNELGVDWRSLITLTKILADEGKLEKIEHLYYPVGESGA
jgi:hypothetical protein